MTKPAQPPKACEACGRMFGRKAGQSRAQFAARRFCCYKCSHTPRDAFETTPLEEVLARMEAAKA